ncbi:MAG TPA: hypothetical protein VGV18_02680 [Verrucomicrobiae bacterium]|nr:hypothetical protein [Verrucomicrobiae bacterium]
MKQGCEKALLQAIADGTLGQGSIAGDKYDGDMQQARLGADGAVRRVETFFAPPRSPKNALIGRNTSNY